MAKNSDPFAEFSQYEEKDSDPLAEFSRYEEDTSKKGWESVLSDIFTKAKEAPGEIGESLLNFGPSTIEALKTFVKNPAQGIEDIAVGAGQGLRGLGNLDTTLLEYLRGKGVSIPSVDPNRSIAKRFSPTNWEQSVLGREGAGHQALQSAGSFGPLAAIPGGLATRAGTGALWAASQEQNPFTGAVLGVGGEAIGRAPEMVSKSVGKALSPITRLNEKQLQEALHLTKDTETNFGRVIENPYLGKLSENVISEIPGSGGYGAMQRNADTIKTRGENFLQELKPENITDIGGKLQNALVKAEKETRAEKNAKFKTLNDEAEKLNVQTERDTLRNVARDELEKIHSDPHLESLTDPKVKKILMDMVEESGEKYSLKNTDLLRGKLGEKASDAYVNGESELGKIYADLKKAADADIDKAISTSGNDHLSKLRDEAMDFYRTEWKPFDEPEIVKFTRKGGDPDTLMSSFLKNTQLGERSRLLEKLTDKLNPKEREALAHSYFSNAVTEGKLNPLQLRTLHKKLGENRGKSLLGDKLWKEMSDYSKLVDKNVKSLNLEFNPETGAKLSQIPGWSAIASALATGHFKTALGLPVGAFIGNKILTNPSIRNALVKKLIEARTRQTGKTNLTPFIQALMTQNSGSQEQ